MNSNSLLVDLGCGDGWFSFEIATAASHIDAIDISENLIQIAKHTQKINKINNVNFTVGEVDQVIAANTLYDSVMCMGLFTCILKDYVMSKIITDITSKLKPNGILLVRDSFNKTVTQLFEQEGYVAVYRREDHYTRLFTDKGFELCDEGQLSDSISDTGYFSGFKIFRKV